MSWILGIDTASAELSIGLLHDGKPVISCSRYGRNAHAEHITRAVNFVLDGGGISAGDISHAAIAVGPGSFTGLRIGIAFLKGFLLTRDIPVFPVSSLESMAEAYHGFSGTIIPVMDARHENVFYARFTGENGSLTRRNEDQMMTVQSLSISYKKNDTILVDTLGHTKSTLLSILREWGTVRSVDEIPLQRGLACAAIAQRSVDNTSAWKKSIDILPNYMQPSYAEIKKTRK